MRLALVLPIALTLLVLPRPVAASRSWPSERGMCEQAGMIFIGTVIDRESQWDPSPYVMMSSVMTIEVERVIHGPVPDAIDVWIMGGRIGNRRVWDSEDPTGNVGTRYLLFLYTTPQKFGGFAQSKQDMTGAEPYSDLSPDIEHRFRILLYHVLDPDADLPPEDILTAIWNEHCMQSKVRGKTSRPTQLYLDFIPKGYLRWCHHYRGYLDER